MFALVLFALSPSGGSFLPLAAGLLLLFPLSTDPLRHLPRERMQLFPLSNAQRMHLRILTLFLSPVVWVVLALPLWKGKPYVIVSCSLLMVALLANGVSLLWSRKHAEGRGSTPLLRWPEGPGFLGGLIMKNLREMLCVLDPYLALVLAVGGVAFRFTRPTPGPEAIHWITMLVVLALSTYAQRLFAFDGAQRFERYRLMPIRGWQVLLAKDLAFLLVLMVLVLGLKPLSGLGSGLVLLAMGHRASVLERYRQARWCFVVGARSWMSPLQVVLMVTAGTLAFRLTALTLLPCLGLYLASLFYYGAQLER
jgi:hypothetical protein